MNLATRIILLILVPAVVAAIAALIANQHVNIFGVRELYGLPWGLAVFIALSSWALCATFFGFAFTRSRAWSPRPPGLVSLEVASFLVWCLTTALMLNTSTWYHPTAFFIYTVAFMAFGHRMGSGEFQRIYHH